MQLIWSSYLVHHTNGCMDQPILDGFLKFCFYILLMHQFLWRLQNADPKLTAFPWKNLSILGPHTVYSIEILTSKGEGSPKCQLVSNICVLCVKIVSIRKWALEISHQESALYYLFNMVTWQFNYFLKFVDFMLKILQHQGREKLSF